MTLSLGDKVKTFIFSLFIFLLLPLQGHAFLGGILGNFTGGNDSCPGSVNGNHMVVSFEGLGNTGISKANLSNAFEGQLNYTAMNLPAQIDSPNSLSKAYNCILQQRRNSPNMKISIIGHSCGGVTAVNLAQQLSNAGITVENVLTVDPRCRHSLYTCADNMSSAAFSRPSRVRQFVNFYQCGGGLAGQRVAGACNNRISSSHTFMPSNSQVRQTAYAMLSGQTINTSTCSATQEVPTEQASTPTTPATNPVSSVVSAFAPATSERRAPRDRWSEHPKANRPAKCFRFGRSYDCTWAEASRQSYEESSR